LLINLLQMLAYGLDGFAHAAEALAGGAYGAKRRTAFQQAVISSTLWAAVMALVICLIYAIAGPAIIDLMTVNTEVVAVANHYLPWMIAAPIISVWSYQLDGIFIGATKTKAMRNTVALSLLIYVVLALLLIPQWGNQGLWFSLMAFMALRGITLGIAYPQLLKQHAWQ
jgi:MATE family multidrug resistance protein